MFVRTGATAPAISGVDAAPPAIDGRAATEVNEAVARADAEVVILVDEGLARMAKTGSSCWFATRRKR